MKKILGLMVAALLVIMMVGGGTWAYFSDTEDSTGNVLVAGTLDLGLSNTSELATTGITATWGATDWAPGTTSDGTLYISNSGSIAIQTLKVKFDYTSVDTSGRPAGIDLNDPLVDTDSFDKMLKATTATWKGTDIGASIVGKTLEELKAAGDITLASGVAGETVEPLYVEFTFDSTATNGCQGNEVDVTITVTGLQEAE